MRTSSIYVIGICDNPVKIGIAVDTKKRLQNLQIGCPEELKLHYEVRLPKAAVQDVETAVHRELKSHHRRGEWFNVAAEVAREAIERLSGPVVDNVAYRLGAVRDFTVEDMIEAKMVSSWAREAVQAYRTDLNRISGKAKAEAVHALIERRAGRSALIAFRLAITDRAGLFGVLGRDPSALRKARVALAQALNVVADDFSCARESILLDEIEKIVA